MFDEIIVIGEVAAKLTEEYVKPLVPDRCRSN